jgi:hypothetical protein
MTSGTSNTLYGVWGDASYIYVVGSSGTIRRCPNGGTSWSAMTSGTSNTLRGVWGDASWVYVVGSSGTIRRCPNGGTSWTAMSSGTSNTLYDVWGSSSSDVYAVGDSGTMLHYDGSAWSLMVGRELYQWKESHSGETIIDWTNYPLGSPRDPDGYQDEWSYAGWSAVVIYTSPQTKGHQLYIYDTFRYCDNAQTLNFTIKNFLAPQDVLYDPAAARMTCFVGEGDVIYGAGQYDYECLAEYGVHDWDCLILNDYYLSDATNPWNNVWNSKSNIMAGRFIDGIDIDTFNATYPIIEPGDNTAEVSMPTGLDSWNLVYIVLSFRSETTTGGLLSYEIEVG